MKKYLRVSLLVLMVGIIVYILVSHIIHLTPTQVDKKFHVSCTKIGKTVTIEITDKGFSPGKKSIQTCDKVIVVNKGTLYHQVAFGDHDDHLLYPGFSERPMKPNETNEFVAGAYGEYLLHDHFYDELEGELIIIK